MAAAVTPTIAAAQKRTNGIPSTFTWTLVTQIINTLVDSELVQRSEIQGCTEEEIDRLEEEFGVTIEGLFREYLLAMGQSTGAFFPDGEIAAANFKNMTQQGVAEGIPEGAMVFFHRKDSLFSSYYYIYPSSDPDRSFYFFGNDTSSPVDFSSFLMMLHSQAEFFADRQILDEAIKTPGAASLAVMCYGVRTVNANVDHERIDPINDLSSHSLR